MADIAMCKNISCPSKNSCYRYTAPVNEFWQTYADFIVPEGEVKCDYYWNNNDKEEIIEDK